MKEVQTSVAPRRAAPTANDGPLAADVARQLLTQPDAGVTRISYVGLPEREAVQLLIDARYDGLRAQTARGRMGRMSVTLSARAETPPRADAGSASPDSVAAPEMQQLVE